MLIVSGSEALKYLLLLWCCRAFQLMVQIIDVMATSYNLWKGSRDYKELTSQPLPPAKRVKYNRDKLYDIEIMEMASEDSLRRV